MGWLHPRQIRPAGDDANKAITWARCRLLLRVLSSKCCNGLVKLLQELCPNVVVPHINVAGVSMIFHLQPGFVFVAIIFFCICCTNNFQLLHIFFIHFVFIA